MLAYHKGSVFSGANYALKKNSKKPFIQFFKKEIVTGNVGGAY